MTLPLIGPFNGNTIRDELGQVGGNFVLPDATTTRWLADKPTGDVVFPNNFYGKLSVKIVDTKVVGAIGSAYTFLNVNFGVAFPNRKLIACTCLRGALASPLDIASVIIGGVSANGDDNGELLAAGPANGAGLWAAAVPNGTSGNVTVTWSGQSTTAAALILLSVSNIPTAPHDQSDNIWDGAGSTGVSDTVNVPANGVVIMSTCHSNGAAAAFTGVTKRAEISVGGTTFAVGFDNRQAVQTNKSFGASWAGVAARGFKLRTYAQG